MTRTMQIDLGGIAALVVAAYTLWKVVRMTQKEATQVDADAADKYATASSKTAELNEKLQVRIEKLNTDIETIKQDSETMKLEIHSLKTRVLRRDKLILDWQKGIGVLINQLVALGQTPAWKPENHLENLDSEEYR